MTIRAGITRIFPLLAPALIATAAVLLVYTANLQIVAVADAVSTSVLAAGGASAVALVLTLVLRDRERAAILSSSLVLWYMAYGYVARAVAIPATFLSLLTVAVVFIGPALFLAFAARRLLRPTNFALTTVCGLLVLLQLGSVVAYYASPLPDATARYAIHDEPSRRTTRDIYYLVFDRYGSDEGLRSEMHIERNSLTEWLASKGFVVVRRAHANYVSTGLSLASTLNLDYLNWLEDQLGPGSSDHRPLQRLLEMHAAGQFLAAQGYRYYHLGSWYGPTRTSASADVNLEPPVPTMFRAYIYDTTALATAADALSAGPPTSALEKAHAGAAQFQFGTLQAVASEAGPKLVIAHVLLPHDPYIFTSTGQVVAVGSRMEVEVPSLYAEQLAYTNGEIARLVRQLLSAPADEHPIIVIQADEGPYPRRYREATERFDWATATPNELEMKFGILSAFYLPSDRPGDQQIALPYDGMSSVNTFRLLFSRYFGVDLPFLDDRIYGSGNREFAYDFRDITEGLPAPPP